MSCRTSNRLLEVGPELRAGDVARDDVDAASVAGRRQQLLRLGDVVLVVLGVGAELAVVRVQSPVLALADRRVPVALYGQALGLKLLHVAEDVDVGVAVDSHRECLAYTIVLERLVDLAGQHAVLDRVTGAKALRRHEVHLQVRRLLFQRRDVFLRMRLL
jgi:hypothetical protein